MRKSREQIILEERVIEVFFLAFLNVVSTAYVCSVSESVCVLHCCVCVCSGPVLHWLLQTHLTAC